MSQYLGDGNDLQGVAHSGDDANLIPLHVEHRVREHQVRTPKGPFQIDEVLWGAVLGRYHPPV